MKYGLTDLARKIPRERYSRNLIDTLELWAGPDFRDRTSLVRISSFLGLEGKAGDLDGSKVFDAWKEGRLQEIRDYCAQDVELTRRIYQIITGEVEAPGNGQPQPEQPVTRPVIGEGFSCEF